ncbi:hypothetical protein [Longispora urticae]
MREIKADIQPTPPNTMFIRLRFSRDGQEPQTTASLYDEDAVRSNALLALSSGVVDKVEVLTADREVFETYTRA